MTELEDDNRRVVRAFVKAIGAQDWNALASIVPPGFVRHSYAAGAPGVRSRDDLIQYLRNEYETFPDAHETIEDIVAEGNKVVVRHRFTGTQAGRMGPYPPSGKSMTAEYTTIYRLEGNMIVEAWAEWDNLHGLVQRGHHRSAAQPSSMHRTRYSWPVISNVRRRSLAWSVGDFATRQMCPPDETRWGVYEVALAKAVRTIDDLIQCSERRYPSCKRFTPGYE